MRHGLEQQEIWQRASERAFQANIHVGSKDHWFEMEDFMPGNEKDSFTADWSEKKSQYKGMATNRVRMRWNKDTGKLEQIEEDEVHK